MRDAQQIHKALLKSRTIPGMQIPRDVSRRALLKSAVYGTVLRSQPDFGSAKRRRAPGEFRCGWHGVRHAADARDASQGQSGVRRRSRIPPCWVQLKGQFDTAKVYEDWRKMLDKERKNVDMVCVGTPDHMHAPMAMSSMQRGLPVYGQKPLAHDIYEVRRLTEMARKKKLVTQMGIQIHSRTEYKTAIALVQGGAIGKIKEVHSWSEKKWGDTKPMPDRSDPVAFHSQLGHVARRLREAAVPR